MIRYNSLQMHRFMAKLLHPNAKVSSYYFPAPQIFWDRLIQLGSSQLVLPAIYGALKRKKLLDYAPVDLVSYLQEITDLNQKRNTAVLKQINLIFKLFKKHQINYVFLKGAAMLITRPYDAINERMVGDIDILVSEKDLSRSQQLLIDEGFKAVSNKFSFTKGVFSENFDKHLDRIANPNYIAAVEIHRRLLIKENHLISTNDVLENKQQFKKQYWIPSKYHLWQHAILNWQYNDNGIIRNELAFRTVLDVLYLESTEILAKVKTSSKAVKSFYSLLSLYYGNYKTYYLQKRIIYKLKLKSRCFYNFHTFFINFIEFISLVFSRSFLFLSSKTYRQNILKKPKIFRQRILNSWNK
ncbi:MAG: nucleotidyltransferase family protein [Flavobacteriaceae bacterium]